MSHDMRGHVVVSKTSIPTSIIISNTYTHNLLFTHTHQILNFFFAIPTQQRYQETIIHYAKNKIKINELG